MWNYFGPPPQLSQLTVSDFIFFKAILLCADSTSGLKLGQGLSGLPFCASWCKIGQKSNIFLKMSILRKKKKSGIANRAQKNECEVQSLYRERRGGQIQIAAFSLLVTKYFSTIFHFKFWLKIEIISYCWQIS